MTTSPWSSLNVSPSSVTSTARLGVLGDRRCPRATAVRRRLVRSARRGPARRWPAGRRPGSVSAIASSWPSATCSASSADVARPAPSRNASLRARAAATRSCGRFGPASDGSTVAEVELERVGERRLLGVLVVPEALLLGVGLDQRRSSSSRPARERAGSAASRRRSGRSRTSRRTPGPCWRSSRGRPAAGATRPGRRTRRTCRRRPSCAASR